MFLFLQTEQGNVPEQRSFLSLQKSQARETLGSFRRLFSDSSSRASREECPPAKLIDGSDVAVVVWDSREVRRLLGREPGVLVAALDTLAGEVWDMEADLRAPAPCTAPGLSMVAQQ
jgi:hypothetical protein